MAWTKKFPPAPNNAIIKPPNAGPMIFIKLNPPEFSAMALARSSLGTRLGIMLCLTGSVKVQAIPVINVNTNTCQTWSRPEATSAPISTAVTINTH